MINLVHMKADFKQILREPVMILFMLIPLFIFTVFKLFIAFIMPLISEYTGFDFFRYYGYILTFVFLMSPGMLGTVAGFLMIDDRDEKIYELMSVTPVGYKGYIANRLAIPFAGGVIYTFIGYFVLDVYYISLPALIFISILSGVEGIIISLLLFNVADDKVKGLTYSKALSASFVFCLADLLGIKWISMIAGLLPFYWISKIVYNPGVLSISAAAAIHVFWLGTIVVINRKA
ncbi:MAG: hypothetical protein N3I35_15485 [Clostridia bacterium]|nr:hypothetical protein [Clostridia bacterium]